MKVTAFNKYTGVPVYELEMTDCGPENIADVRTIAMLAIPSARSSTARRWNNDRRNGCRAHR